MNKEILKQLRKQANDFQIIKGWKVGGPPLPACLPTCTGEGDIALGALPLTVCLRACLPACGGGRSCHAAATGVPVDRGVDPEHGRHPAAHRRAPLPRHAWTALGQARQGRGEGRATHDL